MRLIKRPLFTALMALGVAFTAAAQQPPVNVPPTNETAPATSAAPPPADAMPGPTDRLTATDLEAWLDGFMPYALEQTDVAGSVVVVVKDGKVLLEKGYGFSDLEKRAPVDPASGAFAFGLPIAPPSSASFVGNGALSFVVEPAPSYTIEAQAVAAL